MAPDFELEGTPTPTHVSGTVTDTGFGTGKYPPPPPPEVAPELTTDLEPVGTPPQVLQNLGPPPQPRQ